MFQRYLMMFCLAAIVAIAVWIYYTVTYVPREHCTADDPYCGTLTRTPE